MNRYTIRDYDEYLNLESGMNPHQVQLWKTNRIDESKGIVDDYLPITEELYDALIRTEPIPFNNETAYLAYSLLNYEFKQTDLFMASCSIVVFTGTKDNSNFLGRDAKILKDSYRMINSNFTIRIEDKFLDSENGKKEFYELMAHELQHAYRFYNIFLSNNSYNNEEFERMKRYNDAYNVQRNTSNPIEYEVSTIYYLSDRNEISSESNKLYEYLRNHNEINEGNINEYFNENMPLYTIKESLKYFLEKLDSETRTDDMTYVRHIGEVYKRIIDDTKMTPSRAFIKFRTRVVDAAIFANRLFKRTLAKAFDDFDRRINTPNGSNLAKEIIETNKDFDLLREILNRH